MEIFKTDILKEKFKRFQKEELINILECNYCQKTKCGWKHTKFQVDCSYCWKKFCKNCYNFNSTFKLLPENTDEIGKNYIKNFVNDFLQIDSATFTNLVNSKTILPREKNIYIKSYVKSEKNRSQTVKQELQGVEKLIITLKDGNNFL